MLLNTEGKLDIVNLRQVPSVYVLLSTIVGKLSQLVIVDLGQGLPILPVASCAMSETLPGTSLSCYPAQKSAWVSAERCCSVSWALPVSCAFSHNNFLASFHSFTAAIFSKWQVHCVHSPSPENVSGKTTGRDAILIRGWLLLRD